jgi:multidrug efflux pump subunit AcrA (membrane-fusion protein)
METKFVLSVILQLKYTLHVQNNGNYNFFGDPASLMGCNPDKTSKSGNKPEATVAPGTDTTVVETATISQGSFNVETWGNGTLLVGQKAIVPFELQGNLVEVNVRKGQRVTAGIHP